MFKPNQNARVICNKTDPGFKTSEYYNWKYCSDTLLAYIKKNELFIKGTGDIKLNDELFKTCKAIFK